MQRTSTRKRTWTAAGSYTPVSYTHLICNYSRHEQAVRRGEEKGRFEFGGSTVVVLVEPDKVVPDPDLLKNSQEGWETAVRYGAVSYTHLH